MNAAREYLVDQLVIVASHLAESHIFRKYVDEPFCQYCLMSGPNGRPIAHLPSCAVGRVFRAIEELKGSAVDGRPLTSWDHGDFASSRSRREDVEGQKCDATELA